MARLDEIRSKLKVEAPRDLDLRAGTLSIAIKDDKPMRDRYANDACPACGDSKLQELGIRHGGIHWRCRTCTFEYTRKNFEPGQEADAEKHFKLTVDKANKFTSKKLQEIARKELYQSARKEFRRKWTVLYLDDGSRDAELKFGENSGKLVSEVAETPRGRDYLRWIMGADFDSELKEVIDEQLTGADGR